MSRNDLRDERRNLWIEYQAKNHREQTFENYLIRSLMRSREVEGRIRKDERRKVLLAIAASIADWLKEEESVAAEGDTHDRG